MESAYNIIPLLYYFVYCGHICSKMELLRIADEYVAIVESEDIGYWWNNYHDLEVDGRRLPRYRKWAYWFHNMAHDANIYNHSHRRNQKRLRLRDVRKIERLDCAYKALKESTGEVQ